MGSLIRETGFRLSIARNSESANMINARYKKLSGTHAGHTYSVAAPYGEIESPLRWILHCETDEAEKLIVAEDELNDRKVWLPLT